MPAVRRKSAFTLPDNLTRYRIMAVAVAGEQAVWGGRKQSHGAAAVDDTAVGPPLP